MFDELNLSDLIPWAVAAVLIACLLGLLRRSMLRTSLIYGWTLLPLIFVLSIFFFNPSLQAMPFHALLLAAVLIPWATLTLISFNLVRRVREISTGD